MNNGHKHPLLANFDTHLRYLSRYYGPYCHSTIIKSLFDYVNGRIIEHEMEESGFNFPPTARLMPMFLRTKVGAAEILVSMMWPKAIFPEETYLMQYFPVIEELVLFIDFTNDILSYYKEFVIRQEKGNFVANFAETHDMTHLDVLRHLVAYAPQVCSLSMHRGLGRKLMLIPMFYRYLTPHLERWRARKTCWRRCAHSSIAGSCCAPLIAGTISWSYLRTRATCRHMMRIRKGMGLLFSWRTFVCHRGRIFEPTVFNAPNFSLSIQKTLHDQVHRLQDTNDTISDSLDREREHQEIDN